MDAFKTVGVSGSYKFHTARPHASLDITALKCTNTSRRGKDGCASKPSNLITCEGYIISR
jgi:hypothetical protein